MAKKTKIPKTVLERTYNVPLRREFLKSPRYKRAKKAVSALRNFLKRHMKADSLKNVKIGKYANLEIWKHGIKNPPHHIKVNVKKNDQGIVFAEIVGAPEEKPVGIKKPKEIKKPEVKKEEIKKEEEKPKEEIKKPIRVPEVSEMQSISDDAQKFSKKISDKTKEKKEKDKVLTKKI